MYSGGFFFIISGRWDVKVLPPLRRQCIMGHLVPLIANVSLCTWYDVLLHVRVSRPAQYWYFPAPSFCFILVLVFYSVSLLFVWCACFFTPSSAGHLAELNTLDFRPSRFVSNFSVDCTSVKSPPTAKIRYYNQTWIPCAAFIRKHLTLMIISQVKLRWCFDILPLYWEHMLWTCYGPLNGPVTL